MTSLIIYTVGGLLIGAMLIEWTSFHWVFWFVACMALPVAVACVFIIPSQVTSEPGAAKWKNLDLVGVSILTGMNLVAFSYFHCSRARIAAVILFIFSVISGPTNGWASPLVLVPLIISAVMVVGFVYWETLIPVEKAAMYVIGNHRKTWADHVPVHPGRGFTTTSQFYSPSHYCQYFGGVRCYSFSPPGGKSRFTGR